MSISLGGSISENSKTKAVGPKLFACFKRPYPYGDQKKICDVNYSERAIMNTVALLEEPY